MDGADVNVAYWGNGMGQVDDYSLTAYAQVGDVKFTIKGTIYGILAASSFSFA